MQPTDATRQLGAGGDLDRYHTPEKCSVPPCLDTQLVGIAHAEDLLNYIQRFSEDLDARSDKLNADIAMQERRERAFRLWAQQRSDDLRNQREECERERQQLKAQARRMALTGNDLASDHWYPRGGHKN